MRKEEPRCGLNCYTSSSAYQPILSPLPPHSNDVRLAATKALLNSLEFTKANFEKEVRILVETI